jgi:Na+/H+-dicarboxylate symporter
MGRGADRPHVTRQRLTPRIQRAYRRCMTVLVRLLQFLLAVFALLTAAQFVMVLGSDRVGPVEKVALLVVAAACLWACLALPRLAARKRAARPAP